MGLADLVEKVGLVGNAGLDEQRREALLKFAEGHARREALSTDAHLRERGVEWPMRRER